VWRKPWSAATAAPGTSRRPAGDLVEAAALVAAPVGIAPVFPHHLPAGVVIAEVERPVLAHHRIDRPHAGDVVAPAGRAPGDGNDDEFRRCNRSSAA
jgi:hypothetical protein